MAESRIIVFSFAT